MTIIEVILKVLEVLMEIWKWRTDPALAKTRAAAVLTKELSDDVEAFGRALKENDAVALSAHFELLHRRVSQATPGSDSGAVRPPGLSNP
jgi:hypothetical protein